MKRQRTDEPLGKDGSRSEPAAPADPPNQGQLGSCTIYAFVTVLAGTLERFYRRSFEQESVRAVLKAAVGSERNDYFTDGGSHLEDVIDAFNTSAQQNGKLLKKNKNDKSNITVDQLGVAMCVTVESIPLNVLQLQAILEGGSGHAIACCAITTGVEKHTRHAVAAFCTTFGSSCVVEARNSWGAKDPIMEVTRENCSQAVLIVPTIHWELKGGTSKTPGRIGNYKAWREFVDGLTKPGWRSFGATSRQTWFNFANGSTFVGESTCGTGSPCCDTGGEMLSREGERYRGGFADGKRHGWGITTGPALPNGVRKCSACYSKSNGMWTGSVEIEWQNGRKYEGALVNWKPHGRGQMTYGNGSFHPVWAKYTGDWVDGKPEGKGEVLYKSEFDLLQYTGEMKNGLEHGEGSFTYEDGRKYCGQIMEGYRHGSGVYEWPSPSCGPFRTWRGEFHMDRRCDHSDFPDSELPSGAIVSLWGDERRWEYSYGKDRRCTWRVLPNAVPDGAAATGRGGV